jgi:pimeloyl-CoA synthetase
LLAAPLTNDRARCGRTSSKENERPSRLLRPGLFDQEWLADVVITHDEKAFRESSEMEMAITLCTWAAKRRGEFEYRGMRVSGADFRDEEIFATAKGALLLQEMESKRNERLWVFAVGIVTAVVAAMLTSLLS